MAANRKRSDGLDVDDALKLLEDQWQIVIAQAAERPEADYLDDPALLRVVHDSINHDFVAYRFCLPTQLLGKLLNPSLDCLRLQKNKNDPNDTTGWDARSIGRHVIATFNQRQENILGDSKDPYVGNPMRIPKMLRNDPSKKDVSHWNKLVDALEEVERRSDPEFTGGFLRQVLLEMFRRQRLLKFSYPVPPRVSLEITLEICAEFLAERSGGDRAQALAGALFDAIGIHFGIFAQVNRARINASDIATGQAADLECLDKKGKLVLIVEVKDQLITLSDIEATLLKSRPRNITEILFTGKGTRGDEKTSIDERVSKAFTGGQNVYPFNFFDLARSVLALGGEAIRITFLKKIGEHLDTWNTQPRHRQAWQKLLQKL